MNIANTRFVLLLVAAAAAVLGSVIFIARLLASPGDIAEGVSEFVLCMGIAAGLLLAYFLMKNNYTKTLMRLHGWNGGVHAVWVRVYADGQTVPERNSPIVSCPGDLPTVRWEPYKGKEMTHVIVRGQVYQIKG